MKGKVYLEDENKQNLNPNIILHNKKVQFSDKLKRYHDSLTVSSDNSPQVTSAKQAESTNIGQESKQRLVKIIKQQPEVSYFQIDELKQLSKQISLRDVSRISSRRPNSIVKAQQKRWVKTIMEPSKGELKLLQKIQNMLEHQSLKPIYSSINRNKKSSNQNTIKTEFIQNSLHHILKKKEANPKVYSPDAHNRTSTLSDLINLSRLSGLSSKTLQKYLLCLQKEKGVNEFEKSNKVSEFNLLDTERSKELMIDKKQSNVERRCKSDQQIQKWRNQIKQIHQSIQREEYHNNNINKQLSISQMLEAIRSFVRQTIQISEQIPTLEKKVTRAEEQSTNFLQE